MPKRPRVPTVLANDPYYYDARDAARVLELRTDEIQRLVRNGLLTEFRTARGELRLLVHEVMDGRRRRDELLDDRAIRDDEAATLLGVSAAAVRDLVRRGELRAYNIGRTQRVRRNEVLRYLRTRS